MIHFIFCVAFSIFSRLFPIIPNFSPMYSIALFSGRLFGDKKIAWGIILSALLFTDVLLGIYPSLLFTYISYFFIMLLGSRKESLNTFKGLIQTSFLSSLIFFIFCNLGVFLFDGLYELSLRGLIHCYVLAIPFFITSCFSSLIFGALFWKLLLFNERGSESSSPLLTTKQCKIL